ncbi:MAG: single-stranded-DNA-specific exonuclease RecJ [Acidiferrobacteraceae bacterium]|jgi:single-stranded-DNA-specific exonuclease
MRARPEIVRRPPVPGVDELPPELPSVLRNIYRARDVHSPLDLDHSLGRLLAPDTLLGIDAATRLLQEALDSGQRILVVADYDADGATSCALAVRALRLLGAGEVRYIVPDRFRFGYGLTPEIVALAAEENPDVIITVDNGISSIDGVRAAHEQGWRVVVTDHHLAGRELPEADAIVNPNQPGDAFASKSLAGVGVIFYVMLALRARLREAGWFEERAMQEPNLASLLDLVALGTVADLVPLDRNNRILVAQGLARINGGGACPGIDALIRVSGAPTGRLAASDLAFRLAPRLNAAGRLEDMALGIECLLSNSPTAALEMAGDLDRLNRERRDIQETMQEQAREAVASLHLERDVLPRGLCLYDERWHQGVVGLVASRIKEQFHRPVIALAPGENGELKGSARSVPGLHIRDTLDAIATRHPALLRRFGGHAMAAGLTLDTMDLDAFRSAFEEELKRQLGDEELQPRILSDGELQANEFRLDLAEQLRNAGPWGQTFPEPMFDGIFDVVDQRVVGERHLKMRLRQADGPVVDAIAFNLLEEPVAPGWQRVQAAYRLDVNEFQGTRRLQLLLEHVRAIGEAE